MRKCHLVLALLFFASAVDGQVVRGRVFLSDSVTPAAAISVSARNAKGASAGTALALPTGEYVLRLPGAGTFDVQALRIGYRPAILGGVTVGVGDTVVRNIYLSSLPVALEVVDISGDDECSLRGRDGQRLLQIWEQARGALVASHHLAESGSLSMRIRTIIGRQDEPGSASESLYVELDSLTMREEVRDRPIAATASETLLTRGYVRTDGDGKSVFDMPNAETLLSDAFVDGHCFSLRKPPQGMDWVGVGFRPRRTVRGMTDIRGVLWLHRPTAELRRVEFEYVNLPDAEHRICDLKPYVPLTPDRMAETPPFEQPKPRCETQRNRNNRFRLGGHADFTRLSTGEWLVSSWFLRMPPDQGRIRAMPWKHRWVRRQVERCWAGPGCVTVVSMKARLVTLTGQVTAVMRDGELLYQAVPVIDEANR